MKFKYADQIEDIESCPPPDYEPKEKVLYRAVFSDLNDPRNHLPPAIIHPQVSKMKGKKCGAFALSFFKSLGKITGHVTRISRGNPKAALKLGTHFAKAEVVESDGVCSAKASGSGHINLHEYEETSFVDRYEIV